MVQAIGFAFGIHLCDRWQMSWVTATDPWGTDIAVHGEPGNVLLFPTDFVSERHPERQPLPLREASARLGQLLTENRANPAFRQ